MQPPWTGAGGSNIIWVKDARAEALAPARHDGLLFAGGSAPAPRRLDCTITIDSIGEDRLVVIGRGASMEMVLFAGRTPSLVRSESSVGGSPAG